MAAILFLVGIFFLWGLIKPQINLYKANTEKKAAVAEAKAKRDSATYLAQAEVERAKGVAAANKEIAESLTDRYIEWLYVDQMDQLGDHSIIYVPTEGGIPILDAGRGVNSGDAGSAD